MQQVTDLLWRGRIQLGDEPGIYSDAQYGGLCLDFPIELLPYSGDQDVAGVLAIIVEASEVKVYEGFDGHPVTLFALEEVAGGKWVRREIMRDKLDNKNAGRAEIRIQGRIPRYACLRVETNSQLPPGLYDEIVVNQLSVLSETHYGYLGWRFPNAAR